MNISVLNACISYEHDSKPHQKIDIIIEKVSKSSNNYQYQKNKKNVKKTKSVKNTKTQKKVKNTKKT